MKLSTIKLNACKRLKQEAREKVAEREYNLDSVIAMNLNLVSGLATTPLRSLEEGLKGRRHLTFEEAFCGMCYVLTATNKHFYCAVRDSISEACGSKFSGPHALAAGAAFIQGMAVKEAARGVSAHEVAGLVAAGMMDVVIRLEIPEVIETCGMGGDNGFCRNGSTKKTLNVSTLSALVLSALGLPAIKHGSYGNTSAIGSTDTMESFGANTAPQSKREVMRVWKQVNFCFLDAHWCKTIHDLSHLLMVETVNHIVGPMTPPISPRTRLNKLMGVNAKVHPEVIAKAYAILHGRGKQSIGGVAVITGLDETGFDVNANDYEQVKAHAILDELSPYASVVSLCYEGKFLGNTIVTPQDFGARIDPEAIKVPGVKEKIQAANLAALSGKNRTLADYLAMNTAMALFIVRYLGRGDAVRNGKINSRYLQECFKQCQRVIYSGGALRKLKEYVKASGGKFLYEQQ